MTDPRNGGEADSPDEATAAFQDLTREVADMHAELSVLRRAVEGIGPALSEARAPDYSPTLAEMVTLQKALVVAIGTIEAHPALKTAPEAYAGRVARAAEDAVRGTLRDAEGAAHAIQGSARDVEAVLGSARTREAQNRRLVQVGGIGVVAGLVLFPLLALPLARALAFGSLSDRLAAAVLGRSRWMAGIELMQRADPQQWNSLVEGYTLARAGGDELKACYEAARKLSREQRCSIAVSGHPFPH